MKKYFVSYKNSIKLKELGFNEETFGFYNNGDPEVWIKHQIPPSIFKDYKGDIDAPTYFQSFNFIRENYNLDSFIRKSSKDEYQFEINYIPKSEDDENFKHFIDFGFKTENDANSKCLDKLLEIINRLKPFI